jgi:hypothetical protein
LCYFFSNSYSLVDEIDAETLSRESSDDGPEDGSEVSEEKLLNQLEKSERQYIRDYHRLRRQPAFKGVPLGLSIPADEEKGEAILNVNEPKELEEDKRFSESGEQAILANPVNRSLR